MLQLTCVHLMPAGLPLMDPLQANSPSPLVRGRGRGGVRAKEVTTPSPLLGSITAALDSLGPLQQPPDLPGSLGAPALQLDAPSSSLKTVGVSAGPATAAAAVASAGPSGVGAAGAGQRPNHGAASDESWHTSDSAEEVAFAPGNDATTAAGTSGANGVLGTSTGMAASLVLPKTAAMPSSDFQATCSKAVQFAPELNDYAPVFDSMPRVINNLPPDRVLDVINLRSQVDVAANEARAADAAVMAVSQVLHQKQQQADRAHLSAKSALEQFREFVVQMIHEYNIDVGNGMLCAAADSNSKGGVVTGDARGAGGSVVSGLLGPDVGALSGVHDAGVKDATAPDDMLVDPEEVKQEEQNQAAELDTTEQPVANGTIGSKLPVSGKLGPAGLQKLQMKYKQENGAMVNGKAVDMQPSSSSAPAACPGAGTTQVAA